MTKVSRGLMWKAVVVFSAVFTVWLTFWDVILYLAGVLPGNWGLAAPLGFVIGSVGAYCFIAQVQMKKWGIHFVFRWQTYAGFLLILAGVLPVGVFILAAHERGVHLPAAVWLLVVIGLAAKLAIWWFWCRLFIFKEFLPREMSE